MKRFVIERDIVGVGRLLQGKVQWVQSFIAADKTFCVYLAETEALVREHSRMAGFPIAAVTEAATVIDPMTGFSWP
jgi:hypothetical protein